MIKLFLVLLFSLPTWASGAIVHATPFSTSGSTALSVTISSTTSGDTLLCLIQTIQSGVTGATCSAASDTFTSRGTLTLNTRVMAFGQADGIVSGTTSVTVTPSAFAQMQGYILEISGISGFDLLNSGHANSFGSTTSLSTGNITTTNATDFLVAFWTDVESAAGTYSAMSGGWSSGTGADSSIYGTENTSSTGTVTGPTVTYSSSSGEVNGAIIALKQSGSAAKNCTLSLMGVGVC